MPQVDKDFLHGILGIRTGRRPAQRQRPHQALVAVEALIDRARRARDHFCEDRVRHLFEQRNPLVEQRGPFNEKRAPRAGPLDHNVLETSAKGRAAVYGISTASMTWITPFD